MVNAAEGHVPATVNGPAPDVATYTLYVSAPGTAFQASEMVVPDRRARRLAGAAGPGIGATTRVVLVGDQPAAFAAETRT